MIRKIKGNEVIGKCPKCEADLTKEDIEISIFARKRGHWTYVCLSCKSIIGFSR